MLTRDISLACYIPTLVGFSQLFFSFLTFLLLFAQYGGAIYNLGALTVKYGNFTGNSVDGWVCIIAPHSQCPYQKMLEIPGRELESKLAPLPHRFRTGSAPVPHSLTLIGM